MHRLTMLPIGKVDFNWFDNTMTPSVYQVPGWVVVLDNEPVFDEEGDVGIVIPLPVPSGGNILSINDPRALALLKSDGSNPMWCDPQIIAALRTLGEPYYDTMRSYLAAFVGTYDNKMGHDPFCWPDLIMFDTYLAHLTFDSVASELMAVGTHAEQADQDELAEIMGWWPKLG